MSKFWLLMIVISSVAGGFGASLTFRLLDLHDQDLSSYVLIGTITELILAMRVVEMNEKRGRQ